jgi:hypothetical protein
MCLIQQLCQMLNYAVKVVGEETYMEPSWNDTDNGKLKHLSK